MICSNLENVVGLITILDNSEKISYVIKLVVRLGSENNPYIHDNADVLLMIE